MPNEVRLGDDGFIHNVYRGDQSEASVLQVAEETLALIDELRDRGRPVRLLVDLREMGGSSASSRRASWEALKGSDYDRIAIFGANRFLKHVANLIIRASGRADVARTFGSREQAVAWLKELEVTAPDPP